MCLAASEVQKADLLRGITSHGEKLRLVQFAVYKTPSILSLVSSEHMLPVDYAKLTQGNFWSLPINTQVLTTRRKCLFTGGQC